MERDPRNVLGESDTGVLHQDRYSLRNISREYPVRLNQCLSTSVQTDLDIPDRKNHYTQLFFKGTKELYLVFGVTCGTFKKLVMPIRNDYP